MTQILESVIYDIAPLLPLWVCATNVYIRSGCSSYLLERECLCMRGWWYLNIEYRLCGMLVIPLFPSTCTDASGSVHHRGFIFSNLGSSSTSSTFSNAINGFCVVFFLYYVKSCPENNQIIQKKKKR